MDIEIHIKNENLGISPGCQGADHQGSLDWHDYGSWLRAFLLELGPVNVVVNLRSSQVFRRKTVDKRQPITCINQPSCLIQFPCFGGLVRKG